MLCTRVMQEASSWFHAESQQNNVESDTASQPGSHAALVTTNSQHKTR